VGGCCRHRRSVYIIPVVPGDRLRSTDGVSFGTSKQRQRGPDSRAPDQIDTAACELTRRRRRRREKRPAVVALIGMPSPGHRHEPGRYRGEEGHSAREHRVRFAVLSTSRGGRGSSALSVTPGGLHMGEGEAPGGVHRRRVKITQRAEEYTQFRGERFAREKPGILLKAHLLNGATDVSLVSTCFRYGGRRLGGLRQPQHEPRITPRVVAFTLAPPQYCPPQNRPDGAALAPRQSGTRAPRAINLPRSCRLPGLVLDVEFRRRGGATKGKKKAALYPGGTIKSKAVRAGPPQRTHRA